jgi:hypothetical protein
MNFKSKIALLTMMSSSLMTASAQAASLTSLLLPPAPPALAELQTPPDDANLPQCDGAVFSDLKFVINDEVAGEQMLLSPPTFYVGDYLEVKLQEDLRVCNRYNTVDLWIAIEMPNETRLFLVSGGILPFPRFSLSAAAFKTNLHSGDNAHAVLSFEIPPGAGGEYYFYAGYSEAETDISDLLFTLRSNRAAAKVILGNR